MEAMFYKCGPDIKVRPVKAMFYKCTPANKVGSVKATFYKCGPVIKVGPVKAMFLLKQLIYLLAVLIKPFLRFPWGGVKSVTSSTPCLCRSPGLLQCTERVSACLPHSRLFSSSLRVVLLLFCLSVLLLFDPCNIKTLWDCTNKVSYLSKLQVPYLTILCHTGPNILATTGLPEKTLSNNAASNTLIVVPVAMFLLGALVATGVMLIVFR